MKVAELLGGDLAPKVLPGWRRTTLGEIGEYINGRGFKKSEWATKGLPIIRIQNLTRTGKEQNYYDGEIDERHVVNTGDLLISWAATLGAYLWAGPRAALNQHIFKVHSFIDKKFHYYLMQHILGDLYRQTHGSGMVHITKSKFDSIPIVVPETEDQQKKIVAEIEKQFSRLDEAVASLKRVKANLKRYKAAVLKAAVEGRLVEVEAEIARREGRSYEPGEQLLQRILETRRNQWKGKGKYKEPVPPDAIDLPELPKGWLWTSLDSLIADGPQNGLYLPKSLYGSGHPILRIDDYQQDWIRPVSSLQLVQATLEDVASYSLRLGDLVINRVNSPSHLGKVAIWTSNAELPIFESNMMRVSLSSSVVPAFIAAYLRSAEGRLRLTKHAKWAVNQASINQQDVCRTVIPLPPFAEQNRIVAEVERHLSLIREAECQVEANLKRAERMRQSILASAFSGRLQ